MPFDVAALAQDGVAVIVAAMASEAWQQTRGRLGRLFGRGQPDREQQVLAALDETGDLIGVRFSLRDRKTWRIQRGCPFVAVGSD